MKRYILHRTLAMIPILFGVTLIAFILITLSPSDPARVALRVNNVTVTDQAVKEMQEELGLNKSFFSQYVSWLSHSIQGDFGKSFIDGRPVSKLLLESFFPTLYLAGSALLLIVIISFSSALLCVFFQGKPLDKIIRITLFFITSLPSFWLGLLLIWLFSVTFPIFPTSGMQGFSSFVLPAFTLALGYIPTYTRILRSSMLKNKKENFVLFAIACGVKKSSIYFLVFLSSLQSTFTALGMSIPKLIAGAVVVENIFAWPGLGRLCLSAIFNRDYPVIQSYVFCMASLFVGFSFLCDILNAWIDPRIRSFFAEEE